MNYVHTLGDSTLDNIYWMLNADGRNADDAKDLSVEGQLQKKLDENGKDYEVISHAYDGFTTSSVLDGDHVGRVLGISERYSPSKMGKSYLANRGIGIDDSYFVHPLDDLKNSVLNNPDAIHYVVISVGGNDFREHLHNPIKMLKDIPQINQRYLRILEKVRALGNNNIRPILMFQYRVDAKNEAPYYIYTLMKVIGTVAAVVHTLCIAVITAAALSLLAGKIRLYSALIFSAIGIVGLVLSTRIIPLKVTKNVLCGQEIGMAALGGLMERFYRPILDQAKKDNLPILDLPNTFNPYKDLYLSAIEPGEKGSELIVEGINHIIKNHDYSDDSKSMLYSKKDSSDTYTASDNSVSDWEVSYPVA
jgi:hypothetical protein